jgi:CheY-like chemotaxis protein
VDRRRPLKVLASSSSTSWEDRKERMEKSILPAYTSLMTQTKTPPGQSTCHSRILLVDDEEFLVDLVREILEEAGYEVTAQTSSVAAFHLFSAAPSKFDLVIADGKMPELSGTELSERILEIRPDIPFILYTDYPDAASVKRALSIGVGAIVGKSISMSELITQVRRLLER